MYMKVVMKPIEPIVWFTENGVIKPIKFRLMDSSGSWVVIKVDQIVETKEEKLAGNRMITFVCQSLIQGVSRPYEIKYEIRTGKWFLFKI